jgi:hypothetical protein
VFLVSHSERQLLLPPKLTTPSMLPVIVIDDSLMMIVISINNPQTKDLALIDSKVLTIYHSPLSRWVWDQAWLNSMDLVFMTL